MTLAERTDRALESSLGWIQTSIDEFTRSIGSNPIDQATRLKPLSELMLTATVLRRRDARAAAAIAEHCWRETEDGDELFRLLVARPDFLDLIGLCDSFQRFGLVNPRLHTRCLSLAGLRAALDLESTPWRRVALEYHLHNLDPDGWGPPQLHRDAWMSRLPEPWTIADPTAYGTTHHVFYLTDFGLCPDHLSADVRAWLALWIPAWIAGYRRQGNWDLIAELVMTSECIGVQCEDAVEELAEVQAPDGSVPGPLGAGQALLTADDDPARQRFSERYHTTLVATLAFLLSS